ncbi:unnamed protein product [Linum trigynum]|uniref:NAC domain-containing protein n=1 Tax=Linum trigynum TaxID=586398 RepID=A0AAV2FMG2_9ROSI
MWSSAGYYGGDEEEEMVGYRFHPSEEQLVNHYLKLKMQGRDHEVRRIAEVNVSKFEPWELPGQACTEVDTDESVWYFLAAPDYKYANSKRANRTTKAGYWKPTGKERMVRAESTGEEIGTKRTLVFYKGRVPKGVKTHWIMHEYKSFFNFPNQRDFLLYKLMENSDDDGDGGDEMQANLEGGGGGQASSVMSCNYDNPSPYENYAAVNFQNNEPREDSQIQAYLDSFTGYDESSYNLNSAMQPWMYNTGDTSSSSYDPYPGYG